MSNQTNNQNKICDECKMVILDHHGHFLITWNDEKVPACHLCFDHLVGCEIYTPIYEWMNTPIDY